MEDRRQKAEQPLVPLVLRLFVFSPFLASHWLPFAVRMADGDCRPRASSQRYDIDMKGMVREHNSVRRVNIPRGDHPPRTRTAAEEEEEEEEDVHDAPPCADGAEASASEHYSNITSTRDTVTRESGSAAYGMGGNNNANTNPATAR